MMNFQLGQRLLVNRLSHESYEHYLFLCGLQGVSPMSFRAHRRRWYGAQKTNWRRFDVPRVISREWVRTWRGDGAVLAEKEKARFAVGLARHIACAEKLAQECVRWKKSCLLFSLPSRPNPAAAAKRSARLQLHTYSQAQGPGF
jgi:hypothetical protein